MHSGIFPSTFLHPINSSKNSIFESRYKTQSHKTPHETLKVSRKIAAAADKRCVQAMFLQSERVSEMNFPAVFHLET